MVNGLNEAYGNESIYKLINLALKSISILNKFTPDENTKIEEVIDKYSSINKREFHIQYTEEDGHILNILVGDDGSFEAYYTKKDCEEQQIIGINRVNNDDKTYLINLNGKHFLLKIEYSEDGTPIIHDTISKSDDKYRQLIYQVLLDWKYASDKIIETFDIALSIESDFNHIQNELEILCKDVLYKIEGDDDDDDDDENDDDDDDGNDDDDDDGNDEDDDGNDEDDDDGNDEDDDGGDDEDVNEDDGHDSGENTYDGIAASGNITRMRGIMYAYIRMVAVLIDNTLIGPNFIEYIDRFKDKNIRASINKIDNRYDRFEVVFNEPFFIKFNVNVNNVADINIENIEINANVNKYLLNLLLNNNRAVFNLFRTISHMIEIIKEYNNE